MVMRFTVGAVEVGGGINKHTKAKVCFNCYGCYNEYRLLAYIISQYYYVLCMSYGLSHNNGMIFGVATNKKRPTGIRVQEASTYM